MHGNPKPPTPRLVGITIAETKSVGRATSVVRTEHYTVDDDGATAEQLDGLMRKLNSILADVRSTPTQGA